jgi:hypothetical protein
MRYVTNPTCQSDVDMEASFNAYLSVVLNSLHHEPIKISWGGKKIYTVKIPFYIHLRHLSTMLISSLRHCVLYAIYIQICCVSSLGAGFSSFVTV